MGGICYWARLDTNQELLGNHFGMAGGTITIRATPPLQKPDFTKPLKS